MSYITPILDYFITGVSYELSFNNEWLPMRFNGFTDKLTPRLLEQALKEEIIRVIKQ